MNIKKCDYKPMTNCTLTDKIPNKHKNAYAYNYNKLF